MRYIKPDEAKEFQPLTEEYFHLADSFTRVPHNDGGDIVLYFLCFPENLKSKKLYETAKKVES